MRLNKFTMPLLAALAAGAVTATALAAQDTTAPANPPDAGAFQKVQSVEPQQAAHFAVLRRPQRDGDAVNTPVAGPFGANLRLARLVQTSAGPVRVVPASGRICLRAQDSVGTAWGCVPTDVAIDGKLILSLRTANSEGNPAEQADAVFALLPDDAAGPTATDKSGKRSGLSLEDNVSGAKDSDAETVSFDDAGDQRHATRVP